MTSKTGNWELPGLYAREFVAQSDTIPNPDVNSDHSYGARKVTSGSTMDSSETLSRYYMGV